MNNQVEKLLTPEQWPERCLNLNETDYCGCFECHDIRVRNELRAKLLNKLTKRSEASKKQYFIVYKTDPTSMPKMFINFPPDTDPIWFYKVTNGCGVFYDHDVITDDVKEIKPYWMALCVLQEETTFIKNQ